MGQNIILLADDDRDDREMFQEALEIINDDLLCYSAVNGDELLKQLQGLEELPDLIFLDMNMPVMSGLECLKVLKDDPRYSTIPVIMISTSSHRKEMDDSLILGAQCYFVKPNDFRDLVEILKVITANLGSGLQDALTVLNSKGCKHIHIS
ncbi:response regulator [Flavobacterium sp. Sd200]|uniref:response regulator n=1 Tax=Flavobacterium sp. Sd200 TaxID=2692211 RepID=UPI00136BF26A|nr:response regulator [Flavobacterium sp. Sd200]MXN93341.1 response regulator [Flavobacterium sp. Sd200]